MSLGALSAHPLRFRHVASIVHIDFGPYECTVCNVNVAYVGDNGGGAMVVGANRHRAIRISKSLN